MGNEGILGKATGAVDATEIAGAKEETELIVSDFSLEYYEEKYVNHRNNLGEMDPYIENFFENAINTPGGYLVMIENRNVTVAKEEKTLATGVLENGKIIWSGEVDTNDEVHFTIQLRGDNEGTFPMVARKNQTWKEWAEENRAELEAQGDWGEILVIMICDRGGFGWNEPAQGVNAVLHSDEDDFSVQSIIQPVSYKFSCTLLH